MARGRSRILVPEFPSATPNYDKLREDEFRKLVRDGFSETEAYVERAIREFSIDAATPPTDGQVLTWNDTTERWEPADASAGTEILLDYTAGFTLDNYPSWQNVLSIASPGTGFFSVEVSIRGYSNASTGNMKYRYYCGGAASGYLGFRVYGSSGPGTKGTYNYEDEIPEGTTGVTVTTSGTGYFHAHGHGYIDITTDGTVYFDFLPTADNAGFLNTGSWMRLIRLGDT